MSFALSLRARRLLIAAAAGLLAVPTTLVVQSSQAAPPPPPQACTTIGGFEIDGNMTANSANCTNGGLDWDNVSPSTTSSFVDLNPVKDRDAQNPVTQWTAGGSPSQDSEMDVAYAATELVGGNYYGFLGWHRLSGSGASGFIAELDNKVDIPAADGAVGMVPDRSGGGYVFYLTVDQNGQVSLSSSCHFLGTADYPGVCSTPSSADYAAASNADQVTNPLNGTTMAKNTFVEIGLNLTALSGIVPGCPAPSSVAVLHLRSFTGSSGVANLQQTGGGLQVTPASTCVAPDISTTATPGNSTIDGLNVVAPGTSQHDDVTVGGSGGPAVGTVAFYLCQPNEVTTGCASGGTLVSTETLDANGQTFSGTVDANSTPNDNSAGTYCWRAEYTPVNDSHYNAATHTNATTECFTVAHASPTIATQITTTTQQGAAAGSLGLTTVSDTATLSGVVKDADLSGQTVTFTLYGPFTSVPGAADCTGTPVATRTGTLTKVDATTWHATTTVPSSTVTPTDAGYYTWVATYGGDPINDSAADGCGQANETAHIVGASVAVEKDASSATINAGDDATFDIKVQNLGAGTATGVVVTDPLPVLASGATWTLTTPSNNPYNCAIGADPNRAGAQLVTCTIGTLNPTSWVTIATVSATTDAPDCGTISNTAFLTTTNGGGSGSSTSSVTVNCASLSIIKTPDAATANATDTIGFTVTVSNSGTGDAYGVTVVDTLPTNGGLSWSVDGTSAGVSCNPISGNTLTCTVGTLLHGTSATVHLTSTTTPASCGTVDNSAAVSATNTNGDQTSASLQVQCPDVSITKTADAAAVNAGTAIGFTITVTNNGAGTAYGVDVTDGLPTGTGISWSIASSSGPLTCSPSSAITTLTCTGDLPSGGVETVHVASGTSFASCASYDNTASVTVRNQAGTIADAHASTQVLCADVTIDKTADHASPVNVGSNIGFTITITNTGNGDANGVTVTDDLPAGPGISWIVDAQTGPLTCSPTTAVTTLTCTGDLNSGATETVHVYSATSWTQTNGQDVNSCDNGNNGVYDNTATLQWANGPAQTISSPTAHETVICPNVTFTKDPDSINPVDVGGTIGFTLEVANSGPGTAEAVTVDDPLPSGPGVDWMLASVTGAAANACAVNGAAPTQTLNCSLGDLASGADVTVHITSTTSWTASGGTTVNSCDNGNGGVYDNTATLAISNAPGSTASASTTVQCPNVQVAKAADASAVNAGDSIGFTITVSNPDLGNTGSATQVSLSDVLPTGPAGSGVLWTVDSIDGAAPPASNSPCAITVTNSGQTLACTFGDMAVGSTHVVHLTSPTYGKAGVNSNTVPSCGDYVNTADATVGNEPSPVTSNQATVTVTCPADTIDVVADPNPVSATQQIGFTISGGNAQAAVTSTPVAVAFAGAQFTQANSTGTALGTVVNAVVTSDLPAGDGVLWSIDPAQPGVGCSISGAAGSQVLRCVLGNLLPGDAFAVHIVSATTLDSCATYTDAATLSSDNVPDVSAQDSTTVLCPVLALTKVGDSAGTVGSGQQVGFTMTATNTGQGTAFDAVLTDPLPANAGLDWALDTATAGGGCVVGGAVGSQTLTCSPGDLGPGESLVVHIVSGTTTDSCGNVDNTAFLTADNAAGVQASAQQGVSCPAVITPTPSPSHSVQATTVVPVPPLPNTGAGPIGKEIGWGLGLFGLGLLLAFAGTRRRQRRAH
jgi:uncharacterized repeat protein (TIGR01451 family)